MSAELSDHVTTSVRWGILSTANIGRGAVIPAIHASRNGRVWAVASRDGARAEAFAQANGIARAHESYEALLRDGDIDAVYIPLPNSMHREWTVRAAEAGKHVLCEKPLALTGNECREMVDAADGAGVTLMEAFMYRFHPRTERVVELVRAGTIGALHAIQASFSFQLRTRDNIRLQAALGGGALMDVGCYCVNVSRTLAGREPTRVFARATIGQTGVDEQLWGMLEFEGELVAQFDCALTMERRETYRAAGTDGYLDVERAFLPGQDAVAFEERKGREEPVVHRVDGADEYQLMVEHFADCVLDGTPPRYSAHEAAANMRVIEALYRSAREGEPVPLESIP